MEVFVDFGLFELLVALGIAALARAIYSHKISGFGLLLVSIGAPATLVIVATRGPHRWLAAVCLATALVNAAVVFGAMERGATTGPRKGAGLSDQADYRKAGGLRTDPRKEVNYGTQDRYSVRRLS